MLAIGQILLRNIWHTGISWADPSLRVLVLWIALLGAMAATRNGIHIRINLIPRYLPPALRALSNRVTDLFAASVCAILAWHAARFVRFEYEDGNLLFASVPAWICELILPLGFGVMAIRLLLFSITGPPPDPGQSG
ncbi:MAG: TRAP transporter small permease [Gammaproteobacteria bacterium]|nr:TRAP transporter small permease [Gammaproteobacteria bacterium]